MNTNKPRISGAIFAKEIPNGPVYAGVIEIDGVKHQISLWEKTSAKGNSYLSISEDKRAAQQDAPKTASQYAPKRPAAPKPSGGLPKDMDDDIPFSYDP